MSILCRRTMAFGVVIAMPLLAMQVAVAGPHGSGSMGSASMGGPPSGMTSGDSSDGRDVDVQYILGPSHSYNSNQYDNSGHHDDGDDQDQHHHGADDAITVASIPEPTTLAMLGIGVLGLGLSRYRRRQ
jgi:hypothetical protein